MRAFRKVLAWLAKRDSQGHRIVWCKLRFAVPFVHRSSVHACVVRTHSPVDARGGSQSACLFRGLVKSTNGFDPASGRVDLHLFAACCAAAPGGD
ncbi:MAG: hypothetical protein CME61_08145 [Halobacteriovoraceae bacterium]|nr:hypothetical protein [Halobacteriovoraceae bacterium]